MDASIKRFILEIIESRNDLTLATLRPDGFPQANTVSYAARRGFRGRWGSLRVSQIDETRGRNARRRRVPRYGGANGSEDEPDAPGPRLGPRPHARLA
jgi:hypothetical protein